MLIEALQTFAMTKKQKTFGPYSKSVNFYPNRCCSNEVDVCKPFINGFMMCPLRHVHSAWIKKTQIYMKSPTF